jgi:hypothetical protein
MQLCFSVCKGEIRQLQSQTNNLTSGLGTNWVNMSSSDQTNQMTVPLNSANGSVFFRLVRPY